MANNLNTRVILHAAQLLTAKAIEGMIDDIHKEKRINSFHTAFVVQELIKLRAAITCEVDRQSARLETQNDVY